MAAARRKHEKRVEAKAKEDLAAASGLPAPSSPSPLHHSNAASPSKMTVEEAKAARDNLRFWEVHARKQLRRARMPMMLPDSSSACTARSRPEPQKPIPAVHLAPALHNWPLGSQLQMPSWLREILQHLEKWFDFLFPKQFQRARRRYLRGISDSLRAFEVACQNCRMRFEFTSNNNSL